MTSKAKENFRAVASTSAKSLELAKTVLKPLLNKQGARLDKLNVGDNAVSFELNKLSLTFRPQNCKVLSEVHPDLPNQNGDKQTFYILDVAGHLVRLAAFKDQATSWMHAIGAIYTGPDPEEALAQAMVSAKRLG